MSLRKKTAPVSLSAALIVYMILKNASQVSNHSGDLVLLGGNITFSCEEDHLFEVDPHMTGFHAECLSNGSFANQLPWKKCANRKKRCVISISIPWCVQWFKQGGRPT